MYRSSEKKILVIDDEEIVRDTVTGYLEDSGFQVIEADDGARGIEQFDIHKPSLVLCDLKMPKKDGIEVLKHVMESPHQVPFIVLSGAGVMADVVQALRLGASDYLFKPLSDLAVLELSIKKNLAQAQLGQELEDYRQQLEVSNTQLRNELDAGRNIQLQLFPLNSLTFQGWNFEYILQPSHYLSGDFVDYFPVSDSEVFFYIADVSGHGVSSAIIALMIKNFIDLARREMEIKQDKSLFELSSIFSSLNLHLLSLGFGRHATLFAGILNVENSELIYCSAAHFPTPIEVKKTGTNVFPVDGLAVGLFEDAEYQTRTCSMTDSYGLFLCSDGILEIIDAPNLMEKESSLGNLVKDNCNKLSAISEKLGLNQVSEVPDDITILTINKIG